MRFQGLNPWAESYNPLAAQAAGNHAQHLTRSFRTDTHNNSVKICCLTPCLTPLNRRPALKAGSAVCARKQCSS
jgi:hypothetical protein